MHIFPLTFIFWHNRCWSFSWALLKSCKNGLNVLLIPYVIVLSADKPDMVRLESNATENSDCSDSLWVKFTCNVSDSNPPIINYYLVGDDKGVTLNNSGMWIQPVSKGGKQVYSCLAQHALGNIKSSNNVTLTVNGKFLFNAPLC